MTQTRTQTSNGTRSRAAEPDVPVLVTRKPTCRAGWPKILVEGGDKAGKSWSLAKLSASPKVGKTVVLVLGEDESRWDEYGKIKGARFEIAVHDGSWRSIMNAVRGARAEAAAAQAAGDPPYVFGFDNVTAEWDGHKDWASLRARNSKKNKAILAQDPDAEIEVTSNYWNDARARHRALMREVLLFPGIVVLIARGSEVTLFQNGQPVNGRTTWSVEGEKNLPFDVSTHIRLSRDARPLLISAAGVVCQIRPGIDPPMRLPDDWSLEGVIFDTLKLDTADTAVGGYTEYKQPRTAAEIRDDILDKNSDPDRLLQLWHEAADTSQLDVEEQNETGDMETLRRMITRIGTERGATPKSAAA